MKREPLQRWLRFEIDPVIQAATQLSERVQAELPTHSGIIRVAAGVAGAAEEAKRAARTLRRPWGLHRLPVNFLAVALVLFTAWLYWQFMHVSTLRIAVPEEDAVELHRQVSTSKRIKYEQVVTTGSQQSVELLASGEVDVAFVQGGIPVPSGLPSLRNPGSEVVLYFVREGVSHPFEVRHIMTSAEGQGSHSVAEEFVEYWRIADQVRFSHDWRDFHRERDRAIPEDVDAVFVVKDLAEHGTLYAIERLHAAGFRLTSPDLGAHAKTVDYLQRTEIAIGYLSPAPQIPERPVATYSVATYLVARAGLTPRLLAAAAHLVDGETDTFTGRGFEPNIDDASELLQGLEAFLGVLIYIGLAFIALLGLEVASYRRRFNELNTLVSLISMHQSNKDVLGLTSNELRSENLLYLSLCSDLLGLISAISNYYAQENPSLLYSNLLDIIQRRCDGLKLNIQTKILHASISMSPLGSQLPSEDPIQGGAAEVQELSPQVSDSDEQNDAVTSS